MAGTARKKQVFLEDSAIIEDTARCGWKGLHHSIIAVIILITVSQNVKVLTSLDLP